MSTPRRGHPVREAFSFVGGVAGLLIFLVTLLDSALVYGAAAGVAILHGLGVHDPSVSVLGQLIMWVGMLLGAFATAAMAIVVGAILGSLLHGLVGAGRAGAGREER